MGAGLNVRSQPGVHCSSAAAQNADALKAHHIIAQCKLVRPRERANKRRAGKDAEKNAQR